MNAAELYELLDRLPDACDFFCVRFTTHDRTDYVQPEGWRCDDYGTLILLPNVDECADEIDEISVDNLKRLLSGGNNDWCSYENEVHNDAAVVIRNDDKDNDYAWMPTSERFSINWKRKRVDIWME